MKAKHTLTSTCAMLACASCLAQNASATGPTLSMSDALGTIGISGIVDAYAGSRQLAGGSSMEKVDSSGLSTSQIVISGSRKLDNGYSPEFSLGMFMRPDDGGQGRFAGDTYFGRNAYVGLASPYGTVRIGRQATGNFLAFLRTNSFGDSSAFGPAFLHNWVAAIAQGPQFDSPIKPPLLTAGSRTLTGVLATTDSAWNNSLVYISPTWMDTTFQLQWSPSETDNLGARWGGSAVYSKGPLTLALAGEHIGTSASPSVSSVAPTGPAAAVLNGQSTWQLSGAYALPWGRISAGVFSTQRSFAVLSNDTIQTSHIGAAIPVGGGNVLFQYATSVQTPTVGASLTRNTTSLAYSYQLTREIDSYAVIMNDQFTQLSDGNSFGLGLRYKF